MKEKVVVISFVSILFIFMILGFIIPDKEVSFSERRKLSKFPEFEVSDLFDGSNSFFEDVSDYLVDQFPYRDTFRKIKGITLLNIFHKTDNNGVFTLDDTIFQLDNEINEKSITHLTERIKYVDDNYLTSNNIYFAMVPDKNYYIEDNKIPRLDYQKLEDSLKNGLPEDYNWIDLTSTLKLSSYYSTDIHWKQEELEPVVAKIRESMDLEDYPFPSNKKTYSPFYGALYGRTASTVKYDTLSYLTDDIIDTASVYNYEKQRYDRVYTPEYLKNIDSYDVFLSGATALLIINNKQSTSNKELILFRDSFGSSLTPLLISNYSKITVIDLRYISSTLLGTIPDIDLTSSEADVLFLYSVPIINNSFTLK